MPEGNLCRFMRHGDRAVCLRTAGLLGRGERGLSPQLAAADKSHNNTQARPFDWRFTAGLAQVITRMTRAGHGLSEKLDTWS